MITKIINGERQRSTCWTWDARTTWYFLPEQRIWQTAKDRELINRYLETGNNLEGREAILHYQNGRLKDYNLAKNRRETDAIDAVMREVPEVPKGFRCVDPEVGVRWKRVPFLQKKRIPDRRLLHPL